MCLHVFPTVHALRIHQRSSILHRTCVFCGFLAKTPTLLRAHSLEHCTTGATSSAPVPGVPLQSPVAGVHPRDPISSPATTLPHVPAPTPTPTPSPPPHVAPPPASTTPCVAPFGPLRAFLPPSPPSPPPPPHTPAPWAPAAELFSCAVHVCRPREDLFQLFVFVKQDRTIALDVGLGDTVETVKAKIQDKEGIPSEQQHLVFGAIVLQDGRTLADYDVSGGCMLDLSFRFVSTQRWPQAFPVILHNVQCVCVRSCPHSHCRTRLPVPTSVGFPVFVSTPGRAPIVVFVESVADTVQVRRRRRFVSHLSLPLAPCGGRERATHTLPAFTLVIPPPPTLLRPSRP